MEQEGLFEKDPALKLRDNKGRFATPLRAYADKAIEENKILKCQVEKFRRAWLASAKKARRLEDELKELRMKIAML